MDSISKLFNRGPDATNTSFASGIDYTSSRFHNTLLAPGINKTLVVNEEMRAQNEKRAFDKAREEELKKNIERA